MRASADAVYAWHAKPDALTLLTPPWENARVIERTGSIEQPGSRVKIRLRAGPFFQTWTAEHTACESGRMFRDVMIAGPFRRWEHSYLFIPDRQNKSWLEDRVSMNFRSVGLETGWRSLHAAEVVAHVRMAPPGNGRGGR
jgi:ligand-binding SRPBCC domain-containing protein